MFSKPCFARDRAQVSPPMPAPIMATFMLRTALSLAMVSAVSKFVFVCDVMWKIWFRDYVSKEGDVDSSGKALLLCFTLIPKDLLSIIQFETNTPQRSIPRTIQNADALIHSHH